jgi:hypothetical protein
VDKTKRNQICLVIAGLFLFSIGLYFYSLRVNYIISSLVLLSGIGFIISGIRYKERVNRKKLTGDERNAYLRSGYFITTIIGSVILFSGLGGAALANYMNARPTALWFLIIVFVGMLLIFAARIVKVTDKRKISA